MEILYVARLRALVSLKAREARVQGQDWKARPLQGQQAGLSDGEEEEEEREEEETRAYTDQRNRGSILLSTELAQQRRTQTQFRELSCAKRTGGWGEGMQGDPAGLWWEVAPRRCGSSKVLTVFKK